MVSPRPLAGVAALALLLAAACAERAGPVPEAVMAAFRVPDSMRFEGRFSRVIDIYKALRDSFANAGDSIGLWRAQMRWGEALYQIGRRDTSEVVLAEALRLAGTDPRREGQTRIPRSILFDRQGRFADAMAEAERALDLARQTDDQSLEAGAWNAIGRINSLSGRYRESIAANERELALRRGSGASPREVANALNELGIGFRHVGRYTDAARALEEALVVYRRMQNPEGQARVSFNLANVYSATGADDRALPLLTDALRLAEEIQDPRGLGFVHNGLGDLYLDAGNLSQARRHLERAIDINARLGVVYGRLQSQLLLARAELAAGRLQEAETALRPARAAADSAGFLKEQVSALSLLARVRAAQGDGAAARQLADRAVVLADSLGDPQAQVDARVAQGAAAEARRDARAPAPYLDALDLLESVRGRLALGDLRMGLGEPHVASYEGAIRTLVARGRGAEALAVAERGRARLLLELMAERDADRAARSEQEEIKQLLRERYEALAQVRPAARAEVDRDIAVLTSRLLAAEAQPALDPTGRLRYPTPAPVAEIRDAFNHPGRTFLAFFWGERAVYGWSVSQGILRAARLGNADSLGAQIEFLTSAISHEPGLEWRAAAGRLHRTLLAPLAPINEDLVVVPDGPMARLPLEVLTPEGQPPLGATHLITYAPSASVILALARGTPPTSRDRAMLAVGNPTPDRGPADPAVATRGPALEPLPFAEEEARAIYGMFREQGSDVLVGRRASLENWRERDPERYRYLHFAAHAIVDDRQPARTRVALARDDLTVSDIRRMRLTAELVSLSACETALGRQVRGEGVIGLPYAFLSAGARAVVVTLWRVRDQAAAEFMREFYAEIARGTAPVAALRAIRRRWLESDGPHAAPVAWAPWILVGGRPAEP